MQIYIVDGAPSLGASFKVQKDSRKRKFSNVKFFPDFANVSWTNTALLKGTPSHVLQRSIVSVANIVLSPQNGLGQEIVFDGSPISYLTYFHHIGSKLDSDTLALLHEVTKAIKSSTNVILLRPVHGKYRPPHKLKIIDPHKILDFDRALTGNYRDFFGHDKIREIPISRGYHIQPRTHSPNKSVD